MPAEHQNGRVGGIYYADDLIAKPLEFTDGGIRVPTGPGMGVEVDEDKIQTYRVAS
jgi:muconate cycloisomerase